MNRSLQGMTVVIAVLVLAFAQITGCSSATPSKSVQPPSAQEEIRGALQHVAQTGEVDSSLMVVREKLEELKKTDAAKAESLLQDLNQLEKMVGQPQQAKAKAQEMLNKLGS